MSIKTSCTRAITLIFHQSVASLSTLCFCGKHIDGKIALHPMKESPPAIYPVAAESDHIRGRLVSKRPAMGQAFLLHPES